MSATLDESPEHHTWTLDGHRITQLCVESGGCRLLSWSLQASLEVRLGAPFHYVMPDRSTIEIDPVFPQEIAPLLSLIKREMVRVSVRREGALELGMRDGASITVPPSRRLEAFEVSGGGALEGLRYVARTGGDAPWEE